MTINSLDIFLICSTALQFFPETIDVNVISTIQVFLASRNLAITFVNFIDYHDHTHPFFSKVISDNGVIKHLSV